MEPPAPEIFGSAAFEDELVIELEEPATFEGFGEPAAFDFGAEPGDTALADDLDFVTEHLTEADVFAKYGLAEKALEHLNAVLERQPKHLGAWDRLLRVHVEEGDARAVAETAGQYLGLLREHGDQATASAIEQMLEIKGFAGPGMGAELAVEEELTFEIQGAEPAEEIEFTLEEPAESGFAIPAPPAEPASEFVFGSAVDAEIAFPEEPGIPVSIPFGVEAEEMPSIEIEPEEMPQLEFYTPESDEIQFAESVEPETAQPAPPVQGLVSEFAFDTGGPAGEDLFFGVEAEKFSELDASVEEELEPVVQEPEPPVEELGEVDFYTEQGELELADAKVDDLEERFPGHLEVQLRRDRLFVRRQELAALQDYVQPAPIPPPVVPSKPVAPAPPPPAPPAPVAPPKVEVPVPPPAPVVPAKPPAAAAPPPAVTPPPVVAPPSPAPLELSAFDIESELMSAMPIDEEEVAPAPAPPAAPELPAAGLLDGLDEQSLFADEDDFFDLAAELEEELGEQQPEEAIPLTDDEQTLEQIFREFKRGVEQQLDSEDYDTHYNLGIAYKEMGLTDEAIAEFQLASKDPKRMVECCSMLGICFLEKAMPQLAIKWYIKGLEAPGIGPEEHLGLLYDLGSTYLQVGEIENAQKAFHEIYGTNSNYRDIAARIRELDGIQK